MKTLLRLLWLPLVVAIAGCAGGWRGGVAPAQWADATSASSAAVAVAKPAAGGSGTAARTSADGTRFVWKGEGTSVALAGEFNSWSTSADPMTKQPDGSFALTKKLEPGRYMYKFVVDGTNWKPDPDATEKADDGFGGTNSVVIVGGQAAVAAPPATKPAVPGKAPSATADGVAFRWTGGGNTVHLAGEFNSWSTSADPMTKQPDGSFTLTKKLEPGRYMYKFVVDGTNWKPDPDATEKADDGFGGTNSVVVVGANAAPVAAPPKPSTPGTGPSASAEGVVFKWTGGGNTVHLAGEFNNWSTSADPMTKQPDGSFTLTRKLEPGRHAYKFVVNGTDWKPDPSATETVDDGFGGMNSVVVVGAAGAAGATPAATPAASTPKAVTGRARPPQVTADGVTFTFAGAARSVSLCGGFNQWAPLADPMRQQADGTWTLTKKLPVGRHAYKFLVDGSHWTTDDANPQSEDDGFGGKNSILILK